MLTNIDAFPRQQHKLRGRLGATKDHLKKLPCRPNALNQAEVRTRASDLQNKSHNVEHFQALFFKFWGKLPED
jgi:hypothetical protein